MIVNPAGFKRKVRVETWQRDATLRIDHSQGSATGNGGETVNRTGTQQNRQAGGAANRAANTAGNTNRRDKRAAYLGNLKKKAKETAKFSKWGK